MFSRSLRTWLTGAVCALTVVESAAGIQNPDHVFRVCADPNNLPFSNLHEQGFENKIASLLSSTLQKKLSYTWWVGRDNLAKNTLNANRCDVLVGVPVGSESVLTTQPYYKSSYVFVSRTDRHLHIQSLYDSRLQRLRIGVHVLGNGFSPPDVVLARQGIRSQVVGYSMLGAYGEPNPPARLIDAVENRNVDVAIVWGPLAGYFAQHEPAPLEVVPVSPDHLGIVPFSYEIALAVRKDKVALRDRLNQVIAIKSREIRAILASYGVPTPTGSKE
jgi:mxaJ protein